MELKEGMYVRTKDGFIDKVINDYKGCCDSPNCNCKHVSCEHNYYDEENIIKASDSIIDLIEAGDYVNGSPVSFIERHENGKTWIYTDSEYKYGYLKEEIKTVVTREEFYLIEYEVK